MLVYVVELYAYYEDVRIAGVNRKYEKRTHRLLGQKWRQRRLRHAFVWLSVVKVAALLLFACLCANSPRGAVYCTQRDGKHGNLITRVRNHKRDYTPAPVAISSPPGELYPALFGLRSPEFRNK